MPRYPALSVTQNAPATRCQSPLRALPARTLDPAPVRFYSYSIGATDLKFISIYARVEQRSWEMIKKEIS